MVSESTCARCGAELSERGGDCARCLLAIAANLHSADATTVGDTARASSVDGPSQFVPGQIVGGYRIERLLGAGGMGEVYAAEALEYGRRLALKVLHRRLWDPEDRARFLREGQLAASVNHPNVVYMFGSEEILGAPVITMELLAGGTLKDRVEEHGPMKAGEAVDAIVHLIDGLEAAHQVGILHRDVKPSNCFVDLDGTVKIGDFGLSISTLTRQGDPFSVPSGIQGTPQFAAPEQLRGDRLDLRADIYAVGATLYYLLTGTAPFDARDLASLLTRVLTEPAPSPRESGAAIPAALDAIVTRCLSKDPAERPASYDELRDALRPFSTEAPMPASLPTRFAAGALDHLILMPLTGALACGAANPTLPAPSGYVATVLYFSLLEGIWGASFGKRLCGLRVVGNSRHGPVGVPRAIVRAVPYVTAWHASIAGILMVDGSNVDGFYAFVARFAVVLAPYLLTGALFITARRANGWASMYDLLTSTRVIQRSPRALAHAFTVEQLPSKAVEAPASGPFKVLGELGPVEHGRLFVAEDPVLKRRVWVHHLPAGTRAISESRRRLARRCRLRWVTGIRTPTAAWDAYEAPDGASLQRIAATAQPWRQVKGWLHRLADEIGRGGADGTLPPLSIDRVWITRRGDAKLLDLAIHSGRSRDFERDGVGPQRFLFQVAAATLMGRSDGDAVIERPLPLEVRTFLLQLASEEFQTWSEVCAGLDGLILRPEHISRRRRAASCLLPGVPLVFLIAAVSFAVAKMDELAGRSPHFVWSQETAPGPPAEPPVPDGIPIVPLQSLMVGMCAVASAGVARGGIVLRFWGIAVASRAGARVSRLRALYRALVAWLPILLSGTTTLVTDLPVPHEAAITLVALAFWVTGAGYSVVHPERGLQDRIAGTWLVPE